MLAVEGLLAKHVRTRFVGEGARSRRVALLCSECSPTSASAALAASGTLSAWITARTRRDSRAEPPPGTSLSLVLILCDSAATANRFSATVPLPRTTLELLVTVRFTMGRAFERSTMPLHSPGHCSRRCRPPSICRIRLCKWRCRPPLQRAVSLLPW